MGRVGEVVIRMWQTAYKMKAQFGKVDAPVLTCEPASVLPMAPRYFLF